MNNSNTGLRFLPSWKFIEIVLFYFENMETYLIFFPENKLKPLPLYIVLPRVRCQRPTREVTHKNCAKLHNLSFEGFTNLAGQFEGECLPLNSLSKPTWMIL